MISYNLSNNKLPSHLREIIQALQDILGRQAYDFLLIGASARDIVLDSIYELGVSRMTEDVDFAVYVPEWGSYEEVLQKLTSSSIFQSTKVPHKLLFKNRYEVDIVPFGEIQNKEGHYTWPPDHLQAMNVAGLMEVSKHSIEVKIEETGFRVASIPGICIMKILAWSDRGYRDNRDGRDLGFILSNYIELKYEDLYTLHVDLMDDKDFDRVVISARIVGREMSDLLKSNLIALKQIKNVLNKETEDKDFSKLALSIKNGGSLLYSTAYKSLEAMIQGLEDERNPT